jgi:toxin secretion/phage lysis holin
MNTVKLIFSIVADIFIYILGGWDISIQVFLIFILLDICTGLLCGYKTKNISSKKSYEGVSKKLGYFVAIILAVGLDRLLGQTGVFRTMLVYYLVATDGISIVENLAIIGVPLPEKLKDSLINIKNKQK